MDREADRRSAGRRDREALLRSRHRQVLVICALIVAAAPLLKVVNDDRVAVRGMDVLLPPSCPSRTIFNLSCPGCGLTRSFVYLVRGEWMASVHSNRVGWVLMAVVIVQIPYRLHALYGSKRFLLGPATSWWVAVILITMLIGNWVVGLILGTGV